MSLYVYHVTKGSLRDILLMAFRPGSLDYMSTRVYPSDHVKLMDLLSFPLTGVRGVSRW